MAPRLIALHSTPPSSPETKGKSLVQQKMITNSPATSRPELDNASGLSPVPSKQKVHMGTTGTRMHPTTPPPRPRKVVRSHKSEGESTPSLGEARPPLFTGARRLQDSDEVDNDGSSEDELDSLHRALELTREKSGDRHATVGAIWNHIGNYHFRRGEHAKAEDAYNRAAKCNPGEHVAAAHSNLGTVHWTRGNVVTAMQHLHLSLYIHPKKDSFLVASVHHQLGLCHALRQDYVLSLESLETAKGIRVRLAGPYDALVGRTIDAIGRIHFMEQNYEDALRCHERALDILRTRNNASSTRYTLQYIAATHTALREWSSALAAYENVLHQQEAEMDCCAALRGANSSSSRGATAKATAARQAVHDTLRNMATVYRKWGDTERAYEYDRKAASTYQMAKRSQQDKSCCNNIEPQLQ